MSGKPLLNQVELDSTGASQVETGHFPTMSIESRNYLESKPKPRNVERLLSWLLLGSVAMAIVPFGAVPPMPLSIATFVASAVALAAAIVCTGPVRGSWAFVTVALTGGLLTCLIVFQAVYIVGSPVSDGIASNVGIGARAISIEPSDSIYTLMYLGLPLLTFLSAQKILNTDDEARTFSGRLGVFGSIVATYGLGQYFWFPSTNLFMQKVAYLDSLTSTFVNRNSAGTFLGLVCLILFRQGWSIKQKIRYVDLFQSIAGSSSRSTKKQAVRFALVLLLFATTVAALFLTRSRGATASTGIALLILWCFLFFQQSRPEHVALGRGEYFRYLLGGTVVPLAAISACIAVFGGAVLMRTETQSYQDQRFCVFPDIFDLAKSHPWLGSGFGVFRHAFPAFRDPACGLDFVWDRSHNFYLEGWIGLGASFFLVLMVLSITLVIAHIIGLRTRRRMRSYSALGLASLLLVGVHGLVDFSLQIPGVSTYLAALLGATTSLSLGRQAKAAPATADVET